MWISIVPHNCPYCCRRYCWESTYASLAVVSLTDCGEIAFLPHYPYGSLWSPSISSMSSKLSTLACIANIQSQEIIFNWPMPRRMRSFFPLGDIRRYIKSQDIASGEILSIQISTIKVFDDVGRNERILGQYHMFCCSLDITLFIRGRKKPFLSLNLGFIFLSFFPPHNVATNWW